MGNNSDDGDPRPNVIGGVLKWQEGIRVYWDEPGGKAVAVEVEGEGLKEGENLIQWSKFFACGSGKRPNGENELSRVIEVTGTGKGVGIISVFW